MGVWGYGSDGPNGYDYVQADTPSNPQEGETLYDVDADAAFVYDGASWVEMTVTGHGQLSNVSAGQHRSDSNIRTVVDGANISIGGDADTVDGNHASQLGGSARLWYFDESVNSGESGTASNTWNISGNVAAIYGIRSVSDQQYTNCTTEVNYSDGSTNNGDGHQIGHTGTVDSIYLYANSDNGYNVTGKARLRLMGVEVV